MNSANFRGGSFYVEKSEHSELLTDRFKMCTFYLRNSVSLRHQIACQETQDVQYREFLKNWNDAMKMAKEPCQGFGIYVLNHELWQMLAAI